MVEQLDRLMFNKEFRKVLQTPMMHGLSEQENNEEQLIRFRAQIYQEISSGERLTVQKYNSLLERTSALPFRAVAAEYVIQSCMMRLFASQFLMILPADHQFTTLKALKQLPPFQQALMLPLHANIQRRPYLACCLIELYIRKLCTKSIDSNFLSQLTSLLTFQVKLYQVVVPLSTQYLNVVKLMKKLYYIIVHRLISYYNTNLKIQYKDVVISYCSMFSPIYKDLQSGKLTLCLIYNLLKILSANQNNFDLNLVFQSIGVASPSQSPHQKLFTLVHGIDMMIDKRCGKILQQGDRQKQTVRTNLWHQLYYYNCINLNDITLKLDDVVQTIITHRMPSLISILSLKYRMNNVTKEYIEKIYDSPFNDDVQTIKLCFELFNSQEFQKLFQLAENVLSSQACQKLPQRQILVVMCAIFKGVVMGKLDQGLTLSKLNHYQFEKSSKRECILNQQTLIEHVGFAYYNMARHSDYVQNRVGFFAKALEYFERSLKLNQNNYLLTYSISKLYLQSYDYDKAEEFAKLACKNNRDNWEPFALLACVYMCRKRHHKAELIVKQLLNRHPHCSTLYYIRAYTETYKLLQDIHTNQQLEASKFLGFEYYQTYRQRLLRGKDVRPVLFNLQIYIKLSIYGHHNDTNYDQQFFAKVHPQPQMYEDTHIINRYVQSLRNSFELMLQLQQFSICQILMRKIGNEKKKRDMEWRVFKARIHEKKKQTSAAIEEYTQVLLTQPYNPDALIGLSLLEEDLMKASQYIELAAKFRDDDQFNYAKGMFLSKLGEYQRAHRFFLKQARTCWLQSLPDFMYYY